jgi:hypothetical protein
VMIVLGGLFLLSALVNLALLRTFFNLLAFRMSNVVFSIGAGPCRGSARRRSAAACGWTTTRFRAPLGPRRAILSRRQASPLSQLAKAAWAAPRPG